MTPRRSSARAAALRRAQEAKAERDAQRMLRETQIEAALADYYQATAEAERIRSAARRKADAAIAEAGRAAATPAAAAREAVQKLRDLLGGNAEVATLCGITAGAVRDMLASGRPAGGRRDQDETGSGG
jgi:membrane protein involved in colicin uptake